MNLETAVKGLLQVRNDLRSRRGVVDPLFISENMQRLAQYTSAVEEHLGKLEEELEVLEMNKFLAYTKQGKSVNMSETLVKQEVGSHKGQIANLSRLVKSSWALISTSQSRINHLSTEQRMGGKIT
jgi:hypothetical protein